MSNEKEAHRQPVGQEILQCKVRKFGTILVDPPWPFPSKGGMFNPANPENFHYNTMSIEDIAAMPIREMGLERSHLFLWTINSWLEESLQIMRRWGYSFRTHFVWAKTKKDGEIGRFGIGSYFRVQTELCLFGVRGRAPTRSPARRQNNVILAMRREHSRKPDELYDIIERCCPGPRLELFARYPRENWYQWGNQLSEKMQTAMETPGGSTALTFTTPEDWRILKQKH